MEAVQMSSSSLLLQGTDISVDCALSQTSHQIVLQILFLFAFFWMCGCFPVPLLKQPTQQY